MRYLESRPYEEIARTLNRSVHHTRACATKRSSACAPPSPGRAPPIPEAFPVSHRKSSAQQLRELAEVRPEAKDVQRAIAATRAAVVAASSQQRPTVWSLIMQRPRSFAAAATLFLAAILALAIAGGHAPQMAFAQVVEQVETHENGPVPRNTRSTIRREGEPRGPSTVTKIMILGRHRERKEVLAETPGEPLEPGHRWGRSGIGVSIDDLQRGKYVWLDPKKRTFQEMKGFLSISVDDGQIPKRRPLPPQRSTSTLACGTFQPNRLKSCQNARSRASASSASARSRSMSGRGASTRGPAPTGSTP